MISTTLPIVITSAMLAINSLTTTLPYTAQTLSDHEIKLDQRVEGGGPMSDTMADNILLNLAYLNHDQIDPENVNWAKVKANRTISFKLEPNQTFAFQEDVLPKYQGKVALTTNAHFSFNEGFKFDGYLVGDGVCHLASLMNWVAKDANLTVVAPTSHDFMPIPGIDKQYGTSIFYLPQNKDGNAKQNLYITNTLSHKVEFDFIVEGDKLEAKVEELL